MEGTLSDSLSKLSVAETAPITLNYEDITPDFIRTLNQPSEYFLCKISDNWPKLTFGGFKIRDMISGITLIEVQDEEVENENL